MFSPTTLPVHSCSTVCLYRLDVTDLSPTPVTLLAVLRGRHTEALLSPVRTAVLQQNVLAKSIETVLKYLQHCCWLNWTLQWRWQCCGCETAQGNQHWGYGLLVWRRVVRPTQPKITGRGQGSGAVAICIDLSAGIRGGSSARCKVEISLTELHSAVSPGTDLSSFWRSAADSSWCTYRGYRRYTSGGAALLHLIHPIYFQFYPLYILQHTAEN